MVFKVIFRSILLFAVISPAIVGAGIAGSLRLSSSEHQSKFEYQNIPGGTAAILPSRPIEPSDLEAFLDGAISAAMQSHHLVGGAVVVVKDGAIYLSKGYGFSDLSTHRSVDPSTTLFRPGSVSKLFTWTAVMQLVEQGKLDLDADVNRYITQFQIPATYKQPVTLRHIMTHTAGFEEGALGYLFRSRAEDMVPLADNLAQHMPARVRAPGITAAYSNWATALAGLIVSKVSGVSWEDYVEKNILIPLSMNHSTFREPLPHALSANMSKGYVYESGMQKDLGFEYISGFGPAGSLSATPEDMAKFMIAHLQEGEFNGGRILGKDTARQMHARNFSPNPHVAGIGWGIYESYYNGRRVIGHGGATMAFKTNLALLPEEKIGIFITFNSAAGDMAALEITKSFMDRYFPANLPKINVRGNFNDQVRLYSGAYRSTRTSYTKNDKIIYELNEINVVPTQNNSFLIENIFGPAGEWQEIAPGILRQVDGDLTMAFDNIVDGRATSIVGPFSMMSAEKKAWYGKNNLHVIIVVVSIIASISSIVGFAQRKFEKSTETSGMAWARATSFALGISIIGTLMSLMMTFSHKPYELMVALPGSFRIAIYFGLMAALFALIGMFFTVFAWRGKGNWSLWGRIKYTFAITSGLGFIWSLHYWNLLGFHFG